MRIVIDPGHGGKNVGAVRADKHVYERHWALAFGMRLADLLKDAGHEATLTRRKDETVDFWTRGRVAHEAGAELVVSLHLNASVDRRAKGIEIYVRETDKGGLRVADRLKGELPVDWVRGIVTVPKGEGLPAGHWLKKPWTVLRRYECPALLLECGFITNDRDLDEFIYDLAGQHELLEAILRTVNAYRRS